MGNSILDVILGLLLIYITLALLVMKLQEILDGNILRGRASNLHSLLYESTGQDEELKKKILENPLIFALYKDGKAERGIVRRSSGPTAIPPDLFARALLMALNDGSHPAEKFAAPSSFISAKAPSNNRPRIWVGLAGLMVGRESSWVDFEAAIADWYKDIGDRSDGWFKRRAQWWSLCVALSLAIILNVDSFYIAEILSTDSTMRVTFADLATRIDGQRLIDAGSPAAAQPATRNPAENAKQRLGEAMKSISQAAKLDKEFRSFEVSPPSALAISEADSDCSLKNPKGNQNYSNIRTWMYLLPALETTLGQGMLKPAGKDQKEEYRKVYNCMAHITSWLKVAQTVTTDASATNLVADAIKALESVQADVRTLHREQSIPLSLKRRFLENPDNFNECATTSSNRVEFDDCLQKAREQQVRLPFLFIGTTVRPQFCKVDEHVENYREGLFCNGRFEGNMVLGLDKSMYVVPAGEFHQTILPWLAGILVTTLFVALGAPFWFDVLGRVVKLRAAGSAPGESDTRKAQPTASQPASAAKPPLAQPPGPGDGPFSLSRNAFEDGLVARDVVALQQALDIEATSKLDTPTRKAISTYCNDRKLPPTEELSRELFYKITGRDSVRTPMSTSNDGLQLGVVSDLVQPVASCLMACLDFPNRIDSFETRFTHDLRALVVLYRFKRDGKLPPNIPISQREVFRLATAQPAELDAAKADLIKEILDTGNNHTIYPRENPPWMDWAIGELGQVEKGETIRINSNPRICEYLDTAEANAGANGDNCPWCGAFIAWVLTRHIATLPANLGIGRQFEPVRNPLKAKNWENWATDRTPSGGGIVDALGAARAGDVILFKPYSADSSGHVAFFVELDSGNKKVWVLGGNQKKGGRVCLSAFDCDDVVAVRGV